MPGTFSKGRPRCIEGPEGEEEEPLSMSEGDEEAVRQRASDL